MLAAILSDCGADAITCPRPEPLVQVIESLLNTQAFMNKKEASLGTSLVRSHDLVGVPSLKVLASCLACLVAIHVDPSIPIPRSCGRVICSYITHANELSGRECFANTPDSSTWPPTQTLCNGPNRAPINDVVPFGKYHSTWHFHQDLFTERRISLAPVFNCTFY